MTGGGAGWRDWSRRVHVLESASAIAFWMMVALAPAALVAVNVLGLVFDQRAVAGHLVVIADSAPGTFGDLVAAQLQAVAEPSPGTGLVDAALVIAALWTISTCLSILLRALQRGLDRPTAPVGLVRLLGAAIGLAAIVVLGGVATVIDAASTRDRIASGALALALVFALLLGLYRLAGGPGFGPRRTWPGALLGAVALGLIQSGWENLLQASPGLRLTYGVVAGLITSLLAVWLASFSVLAGAYVVHRRSQRG